MESNGKIIHIEHGHLLSPITKLVYTLVPQDKILHYITLPARPVWILKNHRMKYCSLSTPKIINSKYRRLNKNKDSYLVTGHSQAPEATPRYKYYNSGFFTPGFASYIEIFNGNISLQEQHYEL